MKYYRKKGLGYCFEKSLNFKSKSDRNINKKWFLLFFSVCRFWRLTKHVFTTSLIRIHLIIRLKNATLMQVLKSNWILKVV